MRLLLLDMATATLDDYACCCCCSWPATGDDACCCCCCWPATPVNARDEATLKEEEVWRHAGAAEPTPSDGQAAASWWLGRSAMDDADKRCGCCWRMRLVESSLRRGGGCGGDGATTTGCACCGCCCCWSAATCWCSCCSRC